MTGVRCLEEEQAIVTTHAGYISNPGGHLVTNSAKLSIYGRAFGYGVKYECIISGKAFDMGVVSIRRMVTPTELVVVWSVYQVFAVFLTSFTSRYLQ